MKRVVDNDDQMNAILNATPCVISLTVIIDKLGVYDYRDYYYIYRGKRVKVGFGLSWYSAMNIADRILSKKC